jgi:hypothetical protein
MTTDHRGRPTGTNHRPTPRLQQALARQIGVDTNISVYDAAGLASNVIKAHRQGSPLRGRGSVETGPVMTNLPSYIGYKEEQDVMSRISNTPYDDGRDDAWSANVANTNYPHEVNRVVRQSGGTGAYIGKTLKNRKDIDGEYEF